MFIFSMTRQFLAFRLFFPLKIQKVVALLMTLFFEGKLITQLNQIQKSPFQVLLLLSTDFLKRRHLVQKTKTFLSMQFEKKKSFSKTKQNKSKLTFSFKESLKYFFFKILHILKVLKNVFRKVTENKLKRHSSRDYADDSGFGFYPFLMHCSIRSTAQN